MITNIMPDKKKKSNSKTNKKNSMGKNNKLNTKEIWKSFPYKKFRMQYDISNCGNVKNSITGKILKSSLRSNYKSVSCSVEGYSKPFKIHRIVAFAFVKNDEPETKTQVNHINGNKLDNRADNLEWVSKSGNAKHADSTGLRKAPEKAVIRINPETGKEVIFKSAQDACDETGIGRCSIFAVLRGDRRLAGDYYWRYVDSKNADRFEIDFSEYKQLVGFPRYLINAEGKLYNMETCKFIKPSKHTGDGGFQYQVYCPPDHRKTLLIHKLVASYFLKRTDKKHNSVRHKDGNKANNDVSNLE